MFTIIGVKLTSFTTKDGNKVTGYNVYITEERDDVDGLAADRVFISDRVCNRSNFIPHVGDIILYFAYTKFGRLNMVVPYQTE